MYVWYVMPRVLYEVYNDRVQDRVRERGDYKPDIVRVHDITNIFHALQRFWSHYKYIYILLKEGCSH